MLRRHLKEKKKAAKIDSNRVSWLFVSKIIRLFSKQFNNSLQGLTFY
jgi:hypothetical protein